MVLALHCDGNNYYSILLYNYVVLPDATSLYSLARVSNYETKALVSLTQTLEDITEKLYWAWIIMIMLWTILLYMKRS